MEEVEMSVEWRTVQFFISLDGVAEVELDADDSSRVRCSCAGYSSTSRCKHVRFVKARLKDSDGSYEVTMPGDVPDDEAEDALLSAAAWRVFVMKYGEIEVL